MLTNDRSVLNGEMNKEINKILIYKKTNISFFFKTVFAIHLSFKLL